MMESREGSRPLLSAGESSVATDKTNMVSAIKKALPFRALMHSSLPCRGAAARADSTSTASRDWARGTGFLKQSEGKSCRPTAQKVCLVPRVCPTQAPRERGLAHGRNLHTACYRRSMRTQHPGARENLTLAKMFSRCSRKSEKLQFVLSSQAY